MATRASNSPSMLPLFARAGAAAIPGASKLPFVGGGGRDVPDLTLRLRDVAVEPDRLSAYNRVCGFDLRNAVPVTYPHILAFPLQLSLMTDPEFPVPGHRTRAHRQPDHPAPSDQDPHGAHGHRRAGHAGRGSPPGQAVLADDLGVW